VRRYRKPAEREIAGLVASSLAYGRVEQIIRSVDKVFEAAGPSLRRFSTDTSLTEKRRRLAEFKHRFNDGNDMAALLHAVGNAVEQYGSLETLFKKCLATRKEYRQALAAFRGELRARAMCGAGSKPRSPFDYLLPCPSRGSACKRLNMYLRWMVRRDDGIDLAVWRTVSPAVLVMPVDTHVARTARRLGLTGRRTPDWRMAEDITECLRAVDGDDPVKFDFSLCRYGMTLYRKGN
jgi:uncharacterized protein (TIGR02757 family)